MFRKLSISAKLYGTIGLLSVVLLGIGLTGLAGMRTLVGDLDEMHEMGLEGTSQLGRAQALLQENIIELFDAGMHDPRLENYFPDGHGVERHFEAMNTRSAELDALLGEYTANSVATEEGRQAVQALEEARRAYLDDQLAPIVALMSEQKFSRASNRLIRQTLPSYRTTVAPKIDAMLAQKAEYADAQYKAAMASYQWQLWVTIIAMAAGILLAAFMGWTVITRAFARPVNRVVEAAEKMARGDFDFKLEANAKDEVGALVTAVGRVQGSVKGIITKMDHMSAQHDKGEIDVVMPEEEFEGEYRAMAKGVNEMVNGHLTVKRKAMGCVAEFGRGNFEAELEQFPGKKAFINETVEKVRENLKALIADANMLSDAALAGKLDTRADVSRHEGDFRKIVGGVNETLDAVVGPINEVKRVMLGLAEGDLRQKIDGTYHGEFKVLQEAVNDSMDKLKELISGIKGAADTINTGAKEIAAGNTNLSQRTEEQASSLEETASSMEELTSTVKQNADNARQANQLAHGASDVATKGGDKVREVVVTMGAITESSRKISDIIQVIDGIAFQTNILALNAAVEAARAGEQGRGFAVVAGEVRNLAQRSAGAAKEIKTLIGDSVETVEGGSKLVEEAGATMEEIVTAVKRVTDIMAEISAASDEQSQGIEQVSTAVAQMDEVTQQNAALVEESAAAAGSMEDQAHNLAEAVAIFRIDDGKSTHIANPRAKAPQKAAKPVAKPAAAKPRAPAKPPRPATADAGEEWAEF